MKTLYTNLTDLPRDKRFTFVTEDIVVGGSTLAVQSVVSFESLDTSSGQVLMIGELGNEKTEIRRTSITSGQSPSSAYKWVYLRDALQFDHPQDTKVTIIDYDRMETQWAASVNGTKATLLAYPLYITPDILEMVSVDTSASAGFYFQRFNRTIDGLNSDWSDAIPYGGYDDNMVFSIKQRAVSELGEVIDGNIITHEFLNQSLWVARREYHDSPGKRPFRRKFNTIIGTALTGSYRIEMPTDVENPSTAENVYGVRIGSNSNMNYYDKKEWDFDYRGKPHTTLTTAYVRGARDLYVASARDFTASGAVMIENSSISYSDKSNTGGTLRISADGAFDCSAGSDVWQNITYGLPYKFTVFADPGGSSYIYFNMPIDTAYIGQNIYADYYSTLLGYNSDADTLDEPRYDMFVDFLKFRIRDRKVMGNTPVIKTRDGKVVIADADYQQWQMKKATALASEVLLTDIRMAPDVPNELPE
jgi:hypothetical protein